MSGSSIFKSAKRSQNARLSAKLPENSTHATVMVKRIKLPPEGSKRYPSISVVFLSDCEVPYNFKKEKNGGNNHVTNKDSFPPIKVNAGENTRFVSIFSVPAGIVSGDIVVISGLHFNAYKPSNEANASFSFSCVNMAKCEIRVIPQLILDMPSAQRMFDPELDINIMGVERPQLSGDRWTFFAVFVEKGVGGAKPGMIMGEFQVPPFNDTNSYSYLPHSDNKSTVSPVRQDVLTGGSSPEGKVVDNQFLVCMQAEDAAPIMVSVRCRLYSDSIERFHVGALWTQLGPVLVPNLFGVALCVCDPNKTQEQMYDSSDGIHGAMHAAVSFFPDHARIVPECGIECSWEEAEEIARGKLSDPSAVSCYSTQLPPTFKALAQSSAINLLEFKGDASRIKQGVEEGELALYVVSNMLEKCKRDIINKKATLLETFTEMNYTDNFQGNNVAVAIFVIVRDSTNMVEGVKIQDYIKVHADLPAAVDTMSMRAAKRVHYAEAQ